jgi:hypothetical protein
VKDDGRLTLGAAGGFPVDVIAVADVKESGGERFD